MSNQIYANNGVSLEIEETSQEELSGGDNSTSIPATYISWEENPIILNSLQTPPSNTSLVDDYSSLTLSIYNVNETASIATGNVYILLAEGTLVKAGIASIDHLLLATAQTQQAGSHTWGEAITPTSITLGNTKYVQFIVNITSPLAAYNTSKNSDNLPLLIKISNLYTDLTSNLTTPPGVNYEAYVPPASTGEKGYYQTQYLFDGAATFVDIKNATGVETANDKSFNYKSDTSSTWDYGINLPVVRSPLSTAKNSVGICTPANNVASLYVKAPFSTIGSAIFDGGEGAAILNMTSSSSGLTIDSHNLINNGEDPANAGLLVLGDTIDNNSAAAAIFTGGGGVTLEKMNTTGSTLFIDGTNLLNNTVDANAGLFVWADQSTAASAIFDGGSGVVIKNIVATANALKIDSSNLTTNSISQGGLYISGGTSVTSTAVFNGGAGVNINSVNETGSALTIDSSNLTSTTTSQAGLYISGGSSPTSTAIFTGGTGVNINNTHASGNGLYIDSSNLTTTANTNGGLYVSGGSSPTTTAVFDGGAGVSITSVQSDNANGLYIDSHGLTSNDDTRGGLYIWGGTSATKTAIFNGGAGVRMISTSSASALSVDASQSTAAGIYVQTIKTITVSNKSTTYTNSTTLDAAYNAYIGSQDTGKHIDKTSQTVNIGVQTDGRIVATEFDATSDARVKIIKGQSNQKTDLATLMQLGITDYIHRDTATHYGRPHKKLIAQDVDKIFPQAVRINEDYIPDIYQSAQQLDWCKTDRRHTITLERKHSLSEGDKVRLYTHKGHKDITITKINSSHSFSWQTDTPLQESEVFVFGKYVNDLLSIDYDAISMLNVSATQALNNKLETLQTQYKELANTLATLQQNAPNIH